MKNLLIALSATVVFSTTAFAENKCPTADEMNNYVFNAMEAYAPTMLKRINEKYKTQHGIVSVTDGMKFELDTTHGCGYKLVTTGRDAIFLM